MNRNGWQQLRADRLGGEGYDGGNAAPSVPGFIGEQAGLFPQHEWQNRRLGRKNETANLDDFMNHSLGEPA